jgi:hypothetical protein
LVAGHSRRGGRVPADRPGGRRDHDPVPCRGVPDSGVQLRPVERTATVAMVVNGVPAGEHVLGPEWTRYEWTLRRRAIRPGMNAISLVPLCRRRRRLTSCASRNRPEPGLPARRFRLFSVYGLG